MFLRITFVSICLVMAVMAQTPAPQLTQVPPRPTCTPFLKSGACADLWRTYNAALAQRQREELQLYIDRQKQQASDAAAAPLQQQIDDLRKQNSDQQAQMRQVQTEMQAEAAATREAKTATEQDAFLNGIAVGGGGAFALVLIYFGIRKIMSGYTVTKTKAASA